jgi:hypothetical protein
MALSGRKTSRWRVKSLKPKSVSGKQAKTVKGGYVPSGPPQCPVGPPQIKT